MARQGGRRIAGQGQRELAGYRWLAGMLHGSSHWANSSFKAVLPGDLMNGANIALSISISIFNTSACPARRVAWARN